VAVPDISRVTATDFSGEFAMSTHFRMNDFLTDPKLVENALCEGDQLQVSVAEAMKLRQHLRGAIWSAETIRLITDVARIIYTGGEMTAPTSVLSQFAASLVFDGAGKSQQQRAVSAKVVALVIAAAAVIGYAIGHLDADLQPDLVLNVSQHAGQIRIWVPSHG
jgi:hypothetical protein